MPRKRDSAQPQVMPRKRDSAQPEGMTVPTFQNQTYRAASKAVSVSYNIQLIHF
jgi:hypothetical protein